MSQQFRNQVIKIIVEAYDHRVLESATKMIIDIVKKSGVSRYSGPVPLPNKIKSFIVNRSPHIDKESREQFGLSIHKRLVKIEPHPATIEKLRTLELPYSVGVTIEFGKS